MSRAARRTPEKTKGPAHIPFEEFSVKTIDQLVTELEKSKPDGATIEVAPMEDSHHSPCLQEMQSIVVQSVGPEGAFSMYQYCRVCKTAVRVL